MDLDLPPDAPYSKFQQIWGWMCDRARKDHHHSGARWTLTYHRMRYSAHSGASGVAPRDPMPRDREQYSAPPGGRAGAAGAGTELGCSNRARPGALREEALCASSTDGRRRGGRGRKRRGQAGRRAGRGGTDFQQQLRHAAPQRLPHSRVATHARRPDCGARPGSSQPPGGHLRTSKAPRPLARGSHAPPAPRRAPQARPEAPRWHPQPHGQPAADAAHIGSG